MNNCVLECWLVKKSDWVTDIFTDIPRGRRTGGIPVRVQGSHPRGLFKEKSAANK